MIIFLLLNEVKPPLNIYEGGGNPLRQKVQVHQLQIQLLVNIENNLIIAIFIFVMYSIRGTHWDAINRCV